MSRRGAFLKSDLFLWLNLQPAEFRLRGFDRAILAGVDRDLTRRPRERLLDDVNAGSLIVVVDLELLQRARSSATPPPKVEWHPGELYPRVGFIVTNLSRPAERVVVFYNKRGTCEQWIKEGKGAIKWMRLSC